MGAGEACLQSREEAKDLDLGNAQTAAITALEMRRQPVRMGEDALRVVGEGL